MLVNVKARDTDTLPIPHEPGQWITIQRLAWAEIPTQRATDDGASLALLFERAVTDWSYPEPVSPAALRRLDDVTATWLLKEINAFNHKVLDRNPSSSPSIGS